MLYFIRSIDKEKEKIGKLIIKIGVSIHPEERLKELQTGNHNKLIILRTIKCPDYKTLEKNLHQKYKSWNMHGEWFEFTKNEYNECVAVAESLANSNIIVKNNVVSVVNNTQVNIFKPILKLNNIDHFNKSNMLKPNYFITKLYAEINNNFEVDTVSIPATDVQNMYEHINNNVTAIAQIELNDKKTYAKVNMCTSFNRTILMSRVMANKLNAINNSMLTLTITNVLDIEEMVVKYYSIGSDASTDLLMFHMALENRTVLEKGDKLGNFIIDKLKCGKSHINTQLNDPVASCNLISDVGLVNMDMKIVFDISQP